MTDQVLEVRNLQVQFTTDSQVTTAVDGISFSVGAGKILGIVGESGSGKSVTSLAIMGLIPNPPGKITQGEIWFRGRQADGQFLPPVDLVRVPESQKRQYRGGQISMIFQEPMSSLNPVYTIGFQLTEAIQLHRQMSLSEARRQACSLLQEVKLLKSDDQLRQQYLAEYPTLPKKSDSEIQQWINDQKQAFLNRYPHELSGGQIQRVMIAMAISCDPVLLIADEPTTALDVTVQATILELLRELQQRRGMTILFITHDLGVIAELADRVAVMYQGKIVELGDIRPIFLTPKHPYTKGLLACRPPLDRQVNRLPTVSDFMETITSEGGGLELREKVTVFSEVSSLETDLSTSVIPRDIPLLRVQNLQIGFPVKGIFGETKRLFMAVNNVSFEVYAEETLGLVGESGCGKSTLARALLQLIPITGGKVFFEDQEITPPFEHQSWKQLFSNYRIRQQYQRKLRGLRRDLQIVFQDPFSSLDPRMTIGATVMEPMLIHNQGKSLKERKERAAYLLQRVGLSADWMNRYPHEFSGGQRQRICIARALALNPKFIICDESVSALDVSVQAQVLNLLKELQGEFGLTYIFISHDLSVVKFMSDRIMVMNQGKVEEIGPAQQVYHHPQKDYTRQLIASIPRGELVSYRGEVGS